MLLENGTAVRRETRGMFHESEEFGSMFTPNSNLAGLLKLRVLGTYPCCSAVAVTLSIPPNGDRIYSKGTQKAYNVARESRSPIATINLFEVFRTEGLQAIHRESQRSQFACAGALPREKGESRKHRKWIGACEIEYSSSC